MAALRTATDAGGPRVGGRLVPPRRTVAVPARRQRERSGATVEDLPAAARALSVTDGHAATLLDAVCERAGVTKGALCHQFAAKRRLSSAVRAREQRQVGAAVTAAYRAAAGDPWRAANEGSRACPEASLDPGGRRVVVLDAPGALGWEAVLDMTAGCRRQMLRGVENALRSRSAAPADARPLASTRCAGLGETAMAVARAGGPQAALADALAALRTLLDHLARED